MYGVRLKDRKLDTGASRAFHRVFSYAFCAQQCIAVPTEILKIEFKFMLFRSSNKFKTMTPSPYTAEQVDELSRAQMADVGYQHPLALSTGGGKGIVYIPPRITSFNYTYDRRLDCSKTRDKVNP